MKVSICYNVAAVLGLLLMAAPAMAQQPTKQKTQDGSSPTIVGPGSKAYKQKTEGEITEVGPGSKAYYGNSQHSKY